MASDEQRLLSFGVELEFFIFFQVGHQNVVPPPTGFEAHPGAPLIVDRYDRMEDIFEPLGFAIRNVLPPWSDETVLKAHDNPQEVEHDPEWRHLNQYRQWRVEEDPSLSVLPENLEQATGAYSGWTGVEVVSPAYWSTNEAFNEVRRVCEFLQQTFWISTPENCGLHIHVGQGNNWFPITSLRQIGAFLYSADPILARSYPEHRLLDSFFCPSIRVYAAVSLGLRISDLRQQDPNDDENDRPTLVCACYEPGPGLLNTILGLFHDDITEARLEDNFPLRPTNPSYVIDRPTVERGRYGSNFIHDTELDEDAAYEYVPMHEAVEEILSARNRTTVGYLLRGPNRPNYSFQQLTSNHKRTLEFRQAAGTVDPAEIVSRVRIAIRLCEFAANLTPERLRSFIDEFAVAEQNPAYYDFYDLFIELDLRPEARVVQAALAGTLDQAIRDRYFEERHIN